MKVYLTCCVCGRIFERIKSVYLRKAKTIKNGCGYCSHKCYVEDKIIPFIDKFWSKVDKTPGLGPKGDCWEWFDSKDDSGYGSFYYRGKRYRAHRISYCLVNNLEIEDFKELFILHSCDNPACVNPDHLKFGTQKENMEDCVNKGRFSVGVNHYNSKRTEEQIMEIRRLYKTGNYSQRELGRMFDIGYKQIWKIVNNKTWKHLK